MQPSSDAQAPSAIDWLQPGPAPKPNPPGSGLVLTTAGGPSATASTTAPTSTLPVRPAGTVTAGKTENTPEDFDFEIHSHLLREKTGSSLRRATSMIAGYANSNPRLNLTRGAEARAYLTELRHILQPFVDARSANHRLFLDIFNNADVKAGRNSTLSAFHDASGQGIQNRVPTVSELRAYVRDHDSIPYDLMRVNFLQDYIRSLGVALGVNVSGQLQNRSGLLLEMHVRRESMRERNEGRM
ncbi:hypothetical protein LTR78_008007 [Recurvomyces mirabilis]|uniref:Uncharacterized protein n=1 Tax=Recurvomyces mirabilis TaxID=574656 RepID=A0AAE0TV07_9PEZI|nr:hypothetical protein LTR78_008007 [Recurvomyces mirabilis]KAK5150735.1 hypothetical protein LTS14_009797 [Recurvomyces mirabilis]